MRIPIAVQISPFDIEKRQPEIDQVISAFGRYLDEVPRKSSRSKHGLMGPVGKILREVKSGRRDSASLKGYAVRVHEASGKGPSQTALEALEYGIDHLTRLLADTPLTAHDQVLDRIDYGLYFGLRKKALEQREELNGQFRRFLEDRYHTLGELSKAWEEQVVTWDRVYIFGRRSKTWTSANKVKIGDIDAFWGSMRIGVAAPVEALLEDEEE